MNLKSIRWRLPASYAAIALLAAVVLGGVLVATLRRYYGEQERANMRLNAETMSFAITKMITAKFAPKALQDQVKSLSSLVQARVRVLGKDGGILADSGIPAPLQVLTISARLPPQGEASDEIRSKKVVRSYAENWFFKNPGEPFTQTVGSGIMLIFNPEAHTTALFSGPITETIGTPPEFGRTGLLEGGVVTDTIQTWESTDPAGPVGLIAPVNSSLYGYTLFSNPDITRRSDQEVSYPILDQEGQEVAGLVLSEGPSYGWEIVESVVRSWVVASLVAVLLAAGAGWLASRQVTAPLLALTGVTAEMAAGNLAARAQADTHDEFGRLGRSFNEMAGRIEETVITLRSFVADAAHALHTPLTALRTNLELAAQPAGKPQAGKALAGALEQANRLESLVNGLLDLSRIEARLNGQDHAPVSLPDLLRTSAELFASRAEQAGTSFELDLPGEEILVPGDEHQLRQAFDNLLDNALKFTPPGGSIRAGAGQEEDSAVLWVEDTGIGIPPDDLPRLFARFHRGRNAASYPGSGLGLAIVQAVVERHGGQIQVDSRPGKTRFTLKIPRDS